MRSERPLKTNGKARISLGETNSSVFGFLTYYTIGSLTT